MSEHTLKTWLSPFILLLNLGVIIFLFVCYFWGGFDNDEMTTVAAIIIPMFGCYGTAAVRYTVDARAATNVDSPRVSWVFVILSFTVPLLFTAAIGTTIYLQASGSGKVFSTFEEFKKTLLIFQAVFSVYLGQLIYSLFKPMEKSELST